VPCVAIGGITPQNGSTLIAAGAQMLAVVTGVFDQPDIAAAARSYSHLFIKELI
jgi:thiamine-phosphate pyrophosphorylase